MRNPKILISVVLLFVLMALLESYASGQETTPTSDKTTHRHKHRLNATAGGDRRKRPTAGGEVELTDNDKYANPGEGSGEYEYEDEAEEDKFVETDPDAIVSDHVDFILLRLKHISMRTSSDIKEILAVQEEEFKVNPVYKTGWERAVKYFNSTTQKTVFNGTRRDSIVRTVPLEYHIALLAYTMDSPGGQALYSAFNKDTREICSGTDVDKYQWKSFFKLLQLAIQTLGSQEDRWRDKSRFLYRGASRKYELKEGQVIAFQSFISTSAALKVAEDFAGATLFEYDGFYNGTAMAIWDHSYFQHEKEVLFSPLQVFRVDSVHVGTHYTRYGLVKHEIPLPCEKQTSPSGIEGGNGNTLRVVSGATGLEYSGVIIVVAATIARLVLH